jgi:YhcH/YjgK/YiaL family protein
MIFDRLDGCIRFELGERFTTAFRYLASNNFTDLKPGRIDLRENEIYALIQEYTTKPPDLGSWEAHRQYADIQYLVSGKERIFFSPIEYLQQGTYLPEKDILPLSGKGSMIDVLANYFVIFFPEDAHMPGLAINQPETVKKVVVKVRMS